jgi:hypothetical protein
MTNINPGIMRQAGPGIRKLGAKGGAGDLENEKGGKCEKYNLSLWAGRGQRAGQTGSARLCASLG